MADSYTEVSSQSWFGRLGQSIKSVLIGLLMFFISFPLLWWNEGRAVHTAHGLLEAKAAVVTVSPDAVDPAHDQKLVHMTGQASSYETLSDPDFEIARPGLKLRRNVEMFQWVEHESTETQKKLGGGEDRRKTWSYDKQWKSEWQDSAKFRHPDDHANPAAMRFGSKDFDSKIIRLGAFVLSPGLVSQIADFQPVSLDEKSREHLPEKLRAQSRLSDNRFYLPNEPAQKDSPDPSKPSISDLRIAFELATPEAVSIMAVQSQRTFAPWTAKTGTQVEQLDEGTFSPDQMIHQLQSQNAKLTWILRLVGFVIMAMGIAAVFSPLTVVADVVPLFGNLLQMGVGLFAMLMAGALSLFTIALAWLAYRPLLAVGLLAAGVLLIVLLKMFNGRRADPALDDAAPIRR